METYNIMFTFRTLFVVKSMPDEGFLDLAGRLRKGKPVDYNNGRLFDPDVVQESLVGWLAAQEVAK